MKTNYGKLALVALMAAVLVLLAASYGAAQPTAIEQLGEMLYFDEALSNPGGLSCAGCHDPTMGFDEPDANLPVSEGAIPGRFGNRNAPISAYAMYAPFFQYDEEEDLYIGGQFWDGRANGSETRDPLADQAAGPPLNPLEMANPTKQVIVNAIKNSDYAALFEQVWGTGSLDDVDLAYDQMAQSIATFERTSLFAAFDSKYDAYLRECLNLKGKPNDCAQGIGPQARKAGQSVLTNQEWQGLLLFMAENDNDGVLEKGEGAFCVACHAASFSDPADYDHPVVVPAWSGGLIPPLFTDYTYDNLGIPKNWDNPFLYLPPSLNPDGEDWIDLGLGGVLGDEDEYGKFKVMTLRNIGASAPYTHNGWFTSLGDVVHFYNTRDVGDWPAPEVPSTVNHAESGNSGLGPKEEAAITAFMMTLTDGYGR